MTLQDQTAPNALAERVKTAVLSQFSEWATFVEMSEEGDLEIAVPALAGSKAGHLVVATKMARICGFDFRHHIWLIPSTMKWNSSTL